MKPVTGKINATATAMAALTMALVVMEVEEEKQLAILQFAGLAFPAIIITWRKWFTGEGRGILARLGWVK